ncbi:MAG: hypothetical protein RL095_3065 [Verrucomicrobiota bacterium]|jgi:SAM-dependent methyltransferase
MIFPDWFAAELFAALELRSGDEARPEILEALHRLNRAYLSETPAAAGWDQKGTHKAYALFYMTQNMPKLGFVLDRAPPAPERLAAADLGCGPGTLLWALALREAAAGRPVPKLHGVDSDPQMLEIADRIWSRLRRRLSLPAEHLSLEQGDWRQRLDLPAATLMLGNTLVEAGIPDAELLAALKCRELILIEPGTSRHFRRLLELRRQLSGSGWSLGFPCPSAGKCPMQDGGDWCHFRIHRLGLPHMQRMAALAGRQDPASAFCGFLFRRGDTQIPQGAWRLLSAPRRVSRSVVRLVCDGSKVDEIVLNRKSKEVGNEDFQKSAAGSLGLLSPAPATAFKRKRLDEKQSFHTVYPPNSAAADLAD